MLQKNHARISFPILLMGILSLCGLLAILYYTYTSVSIYNSTDYTNSVNETVPKFAALNEQVFSELKHPIEVDPSHAGLRNLPKYMSVPHGGYRYDLSASIAYGIRDRSESAQRDVVLYYKDLLQRQGWQQDNAGQEALQDGRKYYRYHRGTACITLDFDFKASKYTLSIWHDFWSQSFSAPKPPGFMEWFTEWKFGRNKCPA